MKGRLTSRDFIYIIHTVIVPGAPQEAVGEAGIKPGTAAVQCGVTQWTYLTEHHIPNTEPPHP
jgi:hypothetical protein